MLSIYEQLNQIDDDESLQPIEESILTEAVLKHSEYFCNLSVPEQINITNEACEEIEKQTSLIFDSRKFRTILSERQELTQLSNQDLMLFCKALGYKVLKLKSSNEHNTFFAFISSEYKTI